MNVTPKLISGEGIDWKKLPQRNNDSDLYIPPDARKRGTRANQDEARTASVAHDLGMSDVYCSLYPHKYSDGKHVLEYWDRDRSKDGSNSAYEEVCDDAHLWLFGQEGFWEYERGNHPILTDEQAAKAAKSYYEDSLNYKFDCYVEYFKKRGYKPFTVYVSAEDCSLGDYGPQLTKDLVGEIHELIQRYNRGGRDQVKFAVAAHRDVIGDKNEIPGEIHNEVLGDPFGEIWLTAGDRGYVSLRDI